jgi:hypothetical protein
MMIDYTLYYQNVIDVIQFLLEHEFFKINLIYILIQLKLSDNVHIYTEMHMKD